MYPRAAGVFQAEGGGEDSYAGALSKYKAQARCRTGNRSSVELLRCPSDRRMEQRSSHARVRLVKQAQRLSTASLNHHHIGDLLSQPLPALSRYASHDLETIERNDIAQLLAVPRTDEFRAIVRKLPGYDASQAGVMTPFNAVVEWGS